jgi:hypothetical protein
MKIRYENTMDDLMAFHDHYVTQTPRMKRIWSAYRWIGAAVVFLAGFFRESASGNQDTIFRLTIAVVGAVIVALIIKPLMLWSARFLTRQLLSNGNNRGFLGEHELEIVDEGLIERTEYNESKAAWGGFDRIESNSQYTFLFVGPATAHVIPHNRLLSGDYKAFMTEFRERYKPDQKLTPSSH